jgi:zinc protease
MRFKPLALLALTILAACAPQQRLVSAPAARPVWAFQASDVPVDPGYKFGRLPNGMRYVIRANATPKGTALVRMHIAAGSLDEGDAELGYAHFVEHMAFNGSTRVPEGEMVKLLERKGLAFGADTNASTGLEQTVYSLDLPETKPDLIDTALLLMRETASELTISPEAVARERGVVLAEMRDRNSFAWRNYLDAIAFTYPGSRYIQRMPIGTIETLNAATAEKLRTFWKREYVPSQTTLIVVGDIDPAAIEAMVQAKFGDWQPSPAEPQPRAGPVNPAQQGQTDLQIDPALSEQLMVTRHGPWLDEPDGMANRRERILRLIGYAVVNRRLSRRVLEANPPYRSAGFGTSEVFEDGRSTNLVINTIDGGWQRGLTEAASEYRRALQFGFTTAEVAEQIAELRTGAINDAASAETRSNGTLLGGVLALLEDGIVPDVPTNSLARLEAFIPEITPAAVMAALKREAVPLDNPLLRYQGRAAPTGGAATIRAAWDAVARAELKPQESRSVGAFGYSAFGASGTVVSDVVESALGIRQIRFANGVRLNLKRTELDKGKLLVRVNIDGGNMLQTKDNPRAAMLAAMLPAGGLGKHSADDLTTILAGRTVGTGFSSADETFVASGTTTRTDLPLQLSVMAAMVTDPGYRPAGETIFRQAINNMFAALRATPGSSLNADLGRILSDGDPRFSLGPVEEYRALSFAKLKTDIGDRLANGAIEIAIVGDFDEAATIAEVAQTFGSLPPREAEFRPYAEQRLRPFTASRTPQVLRHSGPMDQALLRLTWQTRDGEDPGEALRLQLLERVLQIAITDSLREDLGKAYSPGVGGDQSRVWRGYGTMSVTASVDVSEVATTRTAILRAIAALRDAPPSADLLQRARAPVLEDLANRLKGNGGWMSYVERAQSKPDRIARFQAAPARLTAITAADLQTLAKRYLGEGGALEVLVLPEGAEPPKP